VVVSAIDTHRTIEAVWRIESAHLIASLARVVRDVGRAEEPAQDALVAALAQWPDSGVPDNPAAWLMATAKHRAIDHIRRQALHARKEEDLTREIEEQLEAAAPATAEEADRGIDDELLRLVFTACHPVLATDARVALTLKLLGGLTTAEIARAFLRSPPSPGYHPLPAVRGDLLLERAARCRQT
jgi:predicted RNA polymerase sigma factor